MVKMPVELEKREAKVVVWWCGVPNLSPASQSMNELYTCGNVCMAERGKSSSKFSLRR